MMHERLAPALNVAFSFLSRPNPVKPELRPAWRIGLLLLILERCRKSQANLKQLHVLNWALRSDTSREAFWRVLAGEKGPEETAVRFDPAVNRAIDFALADRVISPTSNADLTPTEKGLSLIRLIQDDADCFQQQKAFFTRLGRKFTKTDAERFFVGEGGF